MGRFVSSLEGKIISSEIRDKKVSFFVNQPHDVIQRHHASGNFYEIEEIDIISSHFREGMTFLDIGANVGNHSIYVGLFLRPRKIIVVEPNPPAVAILQANLALNGLQALVDVRGIGVGLSDHHDTASPETALNNLGATKMKPATGEGAISLIPGDQFIGNDQVDFIKLDVEGMEIQVLNGLAKTLDRCNPIIFIEVDNTNRRAFDSWISENRYNIVANFRRYPSNENFLIVRR